MDDEDHCIVAEAMTKDQFREKYPKAECDSWDDMRDNSFVKADNQVVVAEYWKRIKTPTKLYLVERLKEQEQMIEAIPAPVSNETEVVSLTEKELEKLPQGSFKVLKERDTEEISVIQYILSPSEILKTTKWGGKYIPIFSVYGEEYVSRSGRTFRKGHVHDAIDPSKMLNYNKSQQAEVLAKMPKSVPVGAAGQFTGYEDDWANPDDAQKGYLEYNPVAANGQTLPPPQPFQTPQTLSGFSEGVQEYTGDIQAATSFYGPSLGDNPQSQSGKALLAQQNATNLGTFHLEIAMQAMQRKVAIAIIDLIPHVLDTERQIKILGEDMKEKVVTVNKKYQDETGKERFYNLKKAIYADVVIQASFSAGTRRQEIVDTLLKFAETVPQAQQVIGDLVAGNLDMENSEELAARMRALIPPELLIRIKEMEAQEKGNMPPELAIIKKMQGVIQQLQGQLQQVTEDARKMFQENEQLKKRDDQIKIEVEKVRQAGDIREENIRRDSNLKQEEMRQRGSTQRELIKLRGKE
jgi:hypothetical protein